MYSPFITQHENVCKSIKQRSPLLKHTSHGQLPVTQSRPIHHSCSFTQSPFSLSRVHHTFILFPTAGYEIKGPKHTVPIYIGRAQSHISECCMMIDLVTLGTTQHLKVSFYVPFNNLTQLIYYYWDVWDRLWSNTCGLKHSASYLCTILSHYL